MCFTSFCIRNHVHRFFLFYCGHSWNPFFLYICNACGGCWCSFFFVTLIFLFFISFILMDSTFFSHLKRERKREKWSSCHHQLRYSCLKYYIYFWYHHADLHHISLLDCFFRLSKTFFFFLFQKTYYSCLKSVKIRRSFSPVIGIYTI